MIAVIRGLIQVNPSNDISITTPILFVFVRNTEATTDERSRQNVLLKITVL